MIFGDFTCQWKIVNKGTTHGSVSGPYLSSIFLNDLEIDGYKDISLFKYADDSTVLATITKDSPDISDIVLSKFMDWTVAIGMHCNTSKLWVREAVQQSTLCLTISNNIITFLYGASQFKVIVSLACMSRPSSMKPTSVYLSSEAYVKKDIHKMK